MAKKIDGYIKLQIPSGQANPSPPVGPALGQKGVNIMEFCKAFNASTQKLEQGMPIPVVITVYQDKSFSFETKSPPVSFFIKKTLNRHSKNVATNCAYLPLHKKSHTPHNHGKNVGRFFKTLHV